MTEQTTIEATATVDGQPWTLWVAAPDYPESAIRACPGSVRVESGAVDVSVRYRQLTSLVHTAGCTWGQNLSGSCAVPVCVCAPAVTDPAPLYATAIDLQHQHHAHVDERAREAERLAYEKDLATDAWMREPGRIVVGGSEAGWRLWERRGSGWHNTGVIVAPAGPITDHDPHSVGLWDDAICLYSIRDPR